MRIYYKWDSGTKIFERNLDDTSSQPQKEEKNKNKRDTEKILHLLQLFQEDLSSQASVLSSPCIHEKIVHKTAGK